MPTTINTAEHEAAQAASRTPNNLQEKDGAMGEVRSNLTGTLSGVPAVAEAAPEVTGLTRFKAQYERVEPIYKQFCLIGRIAESLAAGHAELDHNGLLLLALRITKPEDAWHECAWHEVESLLLANDGHFLKLAEAMHQGGILFGVDHDGNPLIADGGVEPIMMGMTYDDAHKAVIFAEKEGRQVPTGYEMFPCFWSPLESGNELHAFENFIKGPFIRSENKKGMRGSWMKRSNGEYANCRSPYVYWNSGDEITHIDDVHYKVRDPRIGVRRLLRVKKA